MSPVWVERAGVKTGLAKNLLRHSSSQFAAVAQQIKTRDDTNALVTHGTAGKYDTQQGPPTTLSGTGVDRTVTLQGNVVRDTTFAVNGALVGSRDVATVEQGIGIGTGLFNRCVLSCRCLRSSCLYHLLCTACRVFHAYSLNISNSTLHSVKLTRTGACVALFVPLHRGIGVVQSCSGVLVPSGPQPASLSTV